MLDQVQEVKDRVDIIEIISSYLTLKKAGANYKANCPFHNEKTPSMMISPERQSFKCFGCGVGGDVITFVEKIEGLDFYNALKLLAERAGVQLKSESVRLGDREFKADKKTRQYEINEWAKKVYHKILLDHPKAEKARNYLEGRGLSKETIANFEIGYAPDSWDFLLRFLQSKGYKDSEAVESGVAIKSDNGKVYDRFRDRIIFPISNIMGNTIAFTSRILVDDGPDASAGVNKSAKYINSSESAIYIKGKTIYGLDKAKLFIKEEDRAVMVEGNMDVIACHQAGFKNTVAVSGTALTLDQLKILTRYGSEILFCFDADNAGQTAMKRGIRLALQNDISVKVIAVPAPFKDPDETIKSDKEKWSKAVKAARPALEYWIDKMIADAKELDVAEKKKIAKEILPVIKIIYSEIEKEHYIKYLSTKLFISEKSLVEALEKSKTDTEFSKKEDTALEKQAKLSPLEKLLGMVWINPDFVKGIGTEFETIKFSDQRCSDLIKMISEKEIDKDKIKPEIAAFYDQLAMSCLSDLGSDDKEILEKEFSYLLGRIRQDQKDEIKEVFARKIREAETSGNKDLVRKLLTEFSSLIK